MSNKNNRVKRLEKVLQKQVELMEDENLILHEENSNLRNLIDQQNDYIKHNLKEIREALTEQHQAQETLSQRLESEKKLRRRRDNELREEIAAVGVRIRLASHTWLGKFIFK